MEGVVSGSFVSCVTASSLCRVLTSTTLPGILKVGAVSLQLTTRYFKSIMKPASPKAAREPGGCPLQDQA